MSSDEDSSCLTRRQRYKLDGGESTLTSTDSGFATQSQENERSESEFSLPYDLADEEGILPEEEERRIRKEVEKELRKEFRKIRQNTQSKQVEIRKDFKRQTDNSRALLIKQRLNAEEKVVGALEEKAETMQEEILRKRAQRTQEIIKMNKSSRDHNFGAGEEWAQEQVEDMASLRKVHSELERAKARKRVGVSMALVAGKKTNFKLGNLLQTEIRRLERPDDIKRLALEMDRLGLGTQATKLTTTLETRAEKDVKLKVTLKELRAKAKAQVELRKTDEIEKARKERIAVWDRLERERKEREEKEKLARMMAALKRKARNMQMWRDFNNTLLNSRIARPQSMSYFPPMRRKSNSNRQRTKSGFT